MNEKYSPDANLVTSSSYAALLNPCGAESGGLGGGGNFREGRSTSRVENADGSSGNYGENASAMAKELLLEKEKIPSIGETRRS